VEINFSGNELRAIEELSQRQELSKERVIIQALRLYQAVVHGVITINQTNDLPKYLPVLEPKEI
jgi:hypothetical protein